MSDMDINENEQDSLTSSDEESMADEERFVRNYLRRTGRGKCLHSCRADHLVESIETSSVRKESNSWNVSTYGLRRAIGNSSREETWIQSSVFGTRRAEMYHCLAFERFIQPAGRLMFNG